MYVIHLRKTLGSSAVAAIVLGFFLLTHQLFYAMVPLAKPATAGADKPLLPLFRVSTESKSVVLSFDVAWGDTVPARVVDACYELGVQPTFFVGAGWAESHADLVRQLVKNGADVASLGTTGRDYRSLRGVDLRRELLLAREILGGFEGIQSGFLRPPTGDYNLDVLQVARSVDYQIVLWDVESRADQLEGPEEVAQRVMGLVRPGSIVHFRADDSYPHVPAVLPVLYRYLVEAGYRVQTLSSLLRADVGQ